MSKLARTAQGLLLLALSGCGQDATGPRATPGDPGAPTAATAVPSDATTVPNSAPPPAPTSFVTDAWSGAPVASSAGDGYVGRAACAGCHADETARWLGSDHDLAMQEVDGQSVLGDFDDATLTHFGVTSTFFRRDGRPMVRTDGPDGEPAEYEIAYAFGFEPLQQYLIRFPGGRLQTLGLCWDSRPAELGGQRWFPLHPDEPVPHDDPLHWTGRLATWNAMCAECHSTNLRRNYRADDRSYRTTYSEIDVACEACHGPGAEHVEWARAAAAAAETGTDAEPDTHMAVSLHGLRSDPSDGGWVFDDGRPTVRWDGPPRPREEITTCSPCHARRAGLRDEPDAGRALLDGYRPALLTEPLYHVDGQILDEVYVYGSFVQSRMFAAGVTCSDCHDPHGLDPYVDGNGLCLRCHAAEHFDAPTHHHHEQGGEAARCVACHMPTTTYMVVDARRDHSLRVPRPDLSVALGTPNACNGCHADRPAAWAAEAVVRWYGEQATQRPTPARALAAGRAQSPGAESTLVALVDDAATPGIVRATALSLLAELLTPDGLPAVVDALRDDDALVRLAAVDATDVLPLEMRAGLLAPSLADPLLAVRIQAAFELAGLSGRQDVPGLAQALDEYLAAQRCQADWPEAQLNLGLVHAATGELDLAVAADREALALEPRFVPASVNLADVLRAQGRDDQGREVLERALALSPDDPMLHHTLGLLLVRVEGAEAALPELARACELDPDRARFAYVYAVALHGLGRLEHGLGVVLEALDRHPADTDLLYLLATLQRDLGDADAALATARRLLALDPRSREASGLVAELERGAR
ncbi:MAG: tetratricopeptide repeat protein [Planctomycetes bacterium]|nr:tetratricopeptide repeat protein [Planctomycetota bacterium]